MFSRSGRVGRLLAAGLLFTAGLVVPATPAGAAPSGAPIAARQVDGIGRDGTYQLTVSEDGVAWSVVATITPPALTDGEWTGYQCLAEDGAHAAVAVLPLDRVGDATARDRGALAYAVDLTTGESTLLATDVGLKYFSPGCGSGSTAVFTSYPVAEQQRTRLRTVDLGTATVVADQETTGQFTSAIPVQDVTVGALGGEVVALDSAGGTHVLAETHGTPFDLAVRGSDLTFRTSVTGDAVRTVPVGELPRVAAPRSAGSRSAAALSAADVENPGSVCSVPRLDPEVQVYQPSPAQVTWAVQQAVRGNLAASTDFPPHTLRGPANAGVPPVVMSAIIAQESNLKQASRHVPAGAAGGPLIGNYYGSNGALTVMNPGNPDCGYGLTQVTTGMRTGNTVYTPDQQRQIATDYRVNVAAGLQILQDKWNQLHGLGIIAGDGDADHLENWYFALWAYNSGVNVTPGAEGTWGLGWTNNPANPDYPPNRAPFLRDSYGDAARPANWPYQERIVGWMGRPQVIDGADAYPKATFAAGRSWLSIPSPTAFCSYDENRCRPGSSNPTNPDAGQCTLDSYRCWWHSPASWTSQYATSVPTQAAGTPEPVNPSVTPATCSVNRSVIPAGSVIVDNQPSPSQNQRGCTAGSMNWTSAGTFTYTYGRNGAGDTLGAIDTHQVGSGLGGHTLFTHTDDGTNPALINTGVWAPQLPGAQYYNVLIFVPAFVGAPNVVYTVDPGDGSPRRSVRVSQTGTETWVTLGTFHLSPGATVTLTNSGSDAVNGKVAFDAIAFVPQGTSMVFTDVPADHQFHEDIAWLAEQGIAGGYSDGTYRPAAQVSRPAMAAFLFRLLNPGTENPLCTGSTRRFADVARGTTFCGVIEWVGAAGISTGTTANGRTTFDVNAQVSRQAMAAFLWRTINGATTLPTCYDGSPFRDVSATSPFCGAIADLAAKGVIRGYDDGTFRPAGTITRQAAAAFLHRAAALLGT